MRLRGVSATARSLIQGATCLAIPLRRHQTFLVLFCIVLSACNGPKTVQDLTESGAQLINTVNRQVQDTVELGKQGVGEIQEGVENVQERVEDVREGVDSVRQGVQQIKQGITGSGSSK
jgi:peptidoglycan hydrolase CwlO-like protein